ncbi:MAG: hypothetical protein JKY95_02380 [Planctomycetaceae bacterium]|nr:hypothetical protein [Planctomycetaceae bacterium]
MYCYFAFGMRIDSSGEIPGLHCIEDCDLREERPVDLTIWIDQTPELTEPAHPVHGDATAPGAYYENRSLFRFEKSGILLIRFHDGTDFYVDRLGTQIWTTWKPPFTSEDMSTYLLGPILGYVLRIRGSVALHASSFVVGDRAIALTGSAGAGKSTTVAALAMRGNPVLADDVTVLEEEGTGFRVLPSYPHLRLWPESAELLLGSVDSLEPITPNWHKLDFNLLDGYQFATSAAHLSTIYFIADRSPEDRAPWVEQVDGQEQLIGLIGNTYGNGLLDESMRLHEFNVLGRLIQSVKVKRVVPHISPDRLGRLCDVILEDCQ